MARDHFKKQPTNEEKFENLNRHINQLYKVMDDINSRLIALSRAKIGEKELAVFLRDDEKNKTFMMNLNTHLEAAAIKEKKEQDDKLKAFAPPTDEPGDEGVAAAAGPAAEAKV